METTGIAETFIFDPTIKIAPEVELRHLNNYLDNLKNQIIDIENRIKELTI